MIELWFGTFIAEGLLYLATPLWKIRRIMATILMVYMLVATWLLWQKLGLVLGLPLGLLMVFRLGNMLRIIKNRMHERYLRRTTQRTSLWLLVIHSALLWGLVIPLTLSEHLAFRALLWAQLIIAAGTLLITIKNILKLRFTMPKTYLTDRELPTVTVAIPARDETIDLEECLRSVLANDYPKLEIIVLDDCSRGRTAEIIRSFAQAGVRFMPGEEPAERWLAKNQAYQKLYEAATGDLILFCCVDARFGPSAIRNMVNLMYSRNKAMLSVLPLRDRGTTVTGLVQPIRYWWELALPRRVFNRPAVVSTCWLISRKALKRLGGFASISHAIIPEGFLARELVKTDEYSFVRSSSELDVKTVKSLGDQRNTAIRTRYPQLRRRPENVILLTIFMTVFLLLPFVILITGVWWGFATVWPAAITCLLLIIIHTLIMSVTDPANSLLAVFNFPLAVVIELAMNYISMVSYEFFTVEWKGRNICIPVMHVVPRLPSVKKL